MSDKITKIGFNVIKDNIENENLEDSFLIFDNFSSENREVWELMAVTDYPIRLNRITFIVFCMEGSIHFNLGLKKMMITKNQLCILLQDQIIQTTEISPDFKAGFMVLRRNFFNSQNHFIETINLHNNLMKQPYFDLLEKEMQEYILIFNRIKEKIVDTNHTYRLQIIQSYFQITFYNIYHLIVARQNVPEKVNQDNNVILYERYIKMVEEHYRKEHSVKFYADKICLTPKYLSSVIYGVSRKHASDWIHEYIVLEAKALLKSTTMNTKNISEILHFCTPSHFGRFFKRYTGLTPNEYKKI
ncbi:MAG: AraC family transcriptional regulator [Lentimicrobiaceae bacterium]|nr:AraC family transcriptional regulator [Lentimicrobiaceae bacterium]